MPPLPGASKAMPPLPGASKAMPPLPLSLFFPLSIS